MSTKIEKAVEHLLREFGDDLPSGDAGLKREMISWVLEKRPFGVEKNDDKQVLWLKEHWEEAMRQRAEGLGPAEKIAALLDGLDRTTQNVDVDFLWDAIRTQPLEVWKALLLLRQPLHDILYGNLKMLFDRPQPTQEVLVAAMQEHPGLRQSLEYCFWADDLGKRTEKLPWLQALPVENLTEWTVLQPAVAVWRLLDPRGLPPDKELEFLSKKMPLAMERVAKQVPIGKFEGREDLLPFVALLPTSDDEKGKALWYALIRTPEADRQLRELLLGNRRAACGLAPLLNHPEDPRSMEEWLALLPLLCFAAMPAKVPRLRSWLRLRPEGTRAKIRVLDTEQQDLFFFFLSHGLCDNCYRQVPEVMLEVREAVRGLIEEDLVLAWVDRQQKKLENGDDFQKADMRSERVNWAQLLFLYPSKEAHEKGRKILQEWVNVQERWDRNRLRLLTGLPHAEVKRARVDELAILLEIEKGMVLVAPADSDYLLYGMFQDHILANWLLDDKKREALDLWLTSGNPKRLQPGQQQVLRIFLEGKGHRLEFQAQELVKVILAKRQKVLPPLEAPLPPEKLAAWPTAKAGSPWTALLPQDLACLSNSAVDAAITEFKTGKAGELCGGEEAVVLRALQAAQDLRVRRLIQKNGGDATQILGVPSQWWHRSLLEERLKAAGMLDEQVRKLLDQAGEEQLPKLVVEALVAVPEACVGGVSWKEGAAAAILRQVAIIWKEEPALLSRAIYKVLEGRRGVLVERTVVPGVEAGEARKLPWLRGLLFALGKLREPLGGKVSKLLTVLKSDPELPEHIREDAKVQGSLFSDKNIDIQRGKDAEERMQQALISLEVAAGKIVPEPTVRRRRAASAAQSLLDE